MQPTESMHLGTIAIKGIYSEQMYERRGLRQEQETDKIDWWELLNWNSIKRQIVLEEGREYSLLGPQSGVRSGIVKRFHADRSLAAPE
jgi:hypothetical protein